MRRLLSYAAWILLAAAMGAWAFVGFASGSILSNAEERAVRAQESSNKSDRVAYAQRLKALAIETTAEREALERYMGNEAIAAIEVIERAGAAAGGKTTVRGATEVSVQDLPGGAKLHTVEFVVESIGTFAQVMHAAELFETLPLPSAVTGLDFERTSNEARVEWQLVTRIRVLTTASINS